MVRHRHRNWIVDGNRQLIDGRLDEAEAAVRGANESLEQELLRRQPDDWEEVSGKLHDLMVDES